MAATNSGDLEPQATCGVRRGEEAFVEWRVRRLVADVLGAGAEELAPEVSLTDELAADSLDLAEIAVALEAAFGIVMPERAVESVRTYGDLVRYVAALTSGRRDMDVGAGGLAVRIWVRLVSPGNGTLRHADVLTPYLAETIMEEASRAGRGARLEVTVAGDTDGVSLRRIEERFAGLAAQGVEVRRAYQRSAFLRPGQPPHPTLIATA